MCNIIDNYCMNNRLWSMKKSNKTKEFTSSNCYTSLTWRKKEGSSSMRYLMSYLLLRPTILSPQRGFYCEYSTFLLTAK